MEVKKKNNTAEYSSTELFLVLASPKVGCVAGSTYMYILFIYIHTVSMLES